MAALVPLQSVTTKAKPHKKVSATPKKSSERDRKRAKEKSSSYLEKMISKTEKFKVEDLLDLYAVYERTVIDHVFRLILFPYVRMSRTWLLDQVRDLLAETDRNRLILTSRARKKADAAHELRMLNSAERAQWSKVVKPRHSQFLRRATRMVHQFNVKGTTPSLDAIQELGVSRLIFDDMGAYTNALLNRYPNHVADWCSARAEGDVSGVLDAEARLRALEQEVGMRREYGWYVAVNLRGYYDLVEKLIHRVTMAYTRLLFRFAHQLRGVTSTEENFSAGYAGLIMAARNYDPVDGSSFTAHCQWWVRSAVLQKQRQSSVISLPSTTWYQLSLLQKGQVEMSGERVADLKERAEMFYANSANAARLLQDSEDQDEYSFESVRVTSPDAVVVMGDALGRSQAVEENHEASNLGRVGREVLEEVSSVLHEEDPSLLFSVLLWAMNSGIDTTLLADVTAPLFLSKQAIEAEGNRHRSALARLEQNTNKKKENYTWQN